eukprot:TRINITY_DN34899_c0_g1_i1.p1 TRINITY_DN34899_c0_g1~~TRINITY_DN34899_c0_g1_i1.p1  ORF type:complete len:277 (+),score=56.99 TRINITY_DN34899_c0_g1_i1:29-859(+)
MFKRDVYLDVAKGNLSFGTATSYLKFSRLAGFRYDAEHVSTCCSYVLNSYFPSWRLDAEEFLSIKRQFVIALLHLGNYKAAHTGMLALLAADPSVDSKVIVGMEMEALGEVQYPKLVEYYKELLKSHPECQMAHKRLVSMAKKRGFVNTALTQLKKYLEIYPMDKEAWLEGAELYAAGKNFAEAAGCIEEAILTNPHSVVLHCLCGDAWLAAGKASQALHHFALAHEMSPLHICQIGLALALKATRTKSDFKVEAGLESDVDECVPGALVSSCLSE